MNAYLNTIEDVCKNCAYCAEVKRWPKFDTIANKVCIYYVLTEQDSFILEVQDNDKCEVFKLKAENMEAIL